MRLRVKIWTGARPVIYQPAVFLSPHAFQGNQRAFLHSSLPTDNVPVIVPGKCRVQRMSELFAEDWASTLALQPFVLFIFGLIFMSIDKVRLIHPVSMG